MTEREIFFEALEITNADARAAYLQGACGKDVTLRRKVEELLKEHFANDSLLSKPAVDGASTVLNDTQITEGPGAQIGRYKLLQKLGEGGFGVVYMAEQKEPVKRRVALKIIKLGMDTKQVVARFEAERQALAMMDHPNIAKVLDAGATDTGRPYFVMELVKGVPITKYCDDNNLTTQERLELFIPVCQAIQHAHQKGIIHRDIKPSNVMVTLHDGVPVPKVIDFGIAKATQQELTEKTIFTQYSQFIGTPAYMSPEQAELSGLDIDTRSDIYSLGVLLYELLVGRTPLDGKELMSGGYDEIRRRIKEEEPAKPSTRVNTLEGSEKTTVARHRKVAPEQLSSELRGDLDWIVLKALEKDRTRRYETANGFALDIKRFLENQPVAAVPPSSGYLLKKYVRRHRGALAVAAAIAGLLVAGITMSTWQAIRATRAQEAAEKAQATALEQKLLAQTEQKKAEAERSRAETEQQKATESEQQSRRLLYAAEMNLAAQAMGKGNLGQVRRLLARYEPTGEKGVATNESLAGLRGWEWRHLWQRSRGDEWLTLRGHTKAAWTALALADNRTIVSGGEDGMLRFWDVETRALIETIPVRDDVFRLAQDQDSRWLVVCGNLGRWSLWNLADRREVLSRTNSTRVAGVAFSPDNQHFAIADWRGVEVWNAPEQRQVKTIARPTVGFLFGLAFSPDGETLAYTVDGTDLVLYDLSRGTETKLGATSATPIASLSFSSGGRFLAAASQSEITVWDALRKTTLPPLTNHLEQIISLAFSPDGKTLASASADQTVRLWDTQTWQETSVLRGHEGEVMNVSYSANGEFLISTGKDATVRVWKSRRPDRQPDHYHFPNGPGNFLPDLPNNERSLFHFGSNRWESATVFDKLTFSKGATKLVPTRLQHAPALAADATVSWLAADVGPGQLEVWRTDPLEKRDTLTVGPGAIHSLAVGRTGAWLAFKRPDHTAEIWDVVGGKREATLPSLTFDGESVIKPLTFWAGDRRLAHYGKSQEPHGRRVDIRLLPEGETRSILSTHKSELSGLAISADGELLATAAWDGEVKLWTVNTGQELGTLAGQMIGFTSLGFSSDGRRLAAGGFDGTITLWDVNTHQQVGHWKAHPGPCRQIVFLDRDQRLVSTGRSSRRDSLFENRVWRAPTLAEIDAAEAKEPPSSDFGGQGKAEDE